MANVGRRRGVLTALLVAAVVAVSRGQEEADFGADEVRANLTALWEEVAYLRQEIANHHHLGHMEDAHDQIVLDVAALQHEHHIHHHHTEEEARIHHPYHHLHHSHDALHHLDSVHRHDVNNIPEEEYDEHDHHFLHGDSNDHGSENENNEHDSYHEHDQYDPERTHEQDHDHDDDHEQSHHHGRNHDHGHNSGHHGHHHGHHHNHNNDRSDDHHNHHNEDYDLHDDHIPSIDSSNHHHHHHDSHHHNHLSANHHHHPRNQDDMAKAFCMLEPNTARPDIAVSGTINISQRKDEHGPVYFDLDLTGFDALTSERSLYGFHVHENQSQSGDCREAGGHFNPHGTTHGGPTDSIRHIGDLGNIEVSSSGRLTGYLVVDHAVAFTGENSIIGKSIVLHAGVDDLGRRGDPGSRATGNSGPRIACCNIHLEPQLYFRFKG